jgi:hypothetical protein
MFTNNFPARVVGGLLALLAVTPGFCAPEPAETLEGLKLVPDTKAAAVYVLPEADFKQYSKFLILEPYIAFKKDWKREHRGVSNSEMERIKERLGNLFVEVFTDTLEAGGYPVVTAAGDDVLILRPALIDLDVTAPDVMTADRGRTYVANAGAVTIYIELLDSTTGAMLARAIDRKAARDRGTFQLSSSVSNAAEARTALKYWAELLRDRLKAIHGK